MLSTATSIELPLIVLNGKKSWLCTNTALFYSKMNFLSALSIN